MGRDNFQDENCANGMSGRLTRTQISDALDALKSMEGCTVSFDAPPEPEVEGQYEFTDPSVVVEFFHVTGGASRAEAHVVFFNESVVQLFLRHYVHVQTNCRAMFPTIWDADQWVPGRVKSCHHLTGMVHLSTIEFDDPINLKHFVKNFVGTADGGSDGVDMEAIAGKMLIFNGDEPSSRLIDHFLRDAPSEVEIVVRFADVLDAVKRASFDLILCDVDYDHSGKSPLELLESVDCRSRVVAITATCPPESSIVDHRLVAGVIQKPLDRVTTLATIQSVLETVSGDESPVTSRFADDEEMSPLIEWYRRHTQQVLHELRSAASELNFDEVRRRCRLIRETAPGYGFDQLADFASAVLTTLDASMSVEESKGDLAKLESMITSMR